MSKRTKDNDVHYGVSKSYMVESAREKGWKLSSEDSDQMFDDLMDFLDATIEEFLDENIPEYGTKMTRAEMKNASTSSRLMLK